jgi:hypothetical protein
MPIVSDGVEANRVGRRGGAGLVLIGRVSIPGV